MNFALDADYFHTRERLGLDHTGRDANAARAHARQAGREAAIGGTSPDDVSGHIRRFNVLWQAYRAGFIEAEYAMTSGAQAALLRSCLDIRRILDGAIHASDGGGIFHAVQAIFTLAAERPESATLPFFCDTPEVASLCVAAVKWRRDTQELERSKARRERWAASLPTAADLMQQVQTAAEGEGTSFDFMGYTLWHEPEHGGWSLTNAYGIDNCAFLASVHQFQWLLDTFRRGDEIGPVPPGCESPDDDDEQPDGDGLLACCEAADAIGDRLGIID